MPAQRLRLAAQIGPERQNCRGALQQRQGQFRRCGPHRQVREYCGRLRVGPLIRIAPRSHEPCAAMMMMRAFSLLGIFMDARVPGRVRHWANAVGRDHGSFPGQCHNRFKTCPLKIPRI